MEAEHSLEQPVSCKDMKTLDSSEEQLKECPEGCAPKKLNQSGGFKAAKKNADVKSKIHASGPDQSPKSSILVRVDYKHPQQASAVLRRDATPDRHLPEHSVADSNTAREDVKNSNGGTELHDDSTSICEEEIKELKSTVEEKATLGSKKREGRKRSSKILLEPKVELGEVNNVNYDLLEKSNAEDSTCLLDDSEIATTPARKRGRPKGTKSKVKVENDSGLNASITPSSVARVRNRRSCVGPGKYNVDLVQLEESSNLGQENQEELNEHDPCMASTPQVSKRGRKRKIVPILLDDLDGDVSASNENEVQEETEQNEGGSRKAVDTPKVLKRGRKRKTDVLSEDACDKEEELTEKANESGLTEAETPKISRRGRKSRLVAVVPEDPEENPENGHEFQQLEATPTPKRRGRKPKAIDNDVTIPIKVKENIICGVCQKEVPESSFAYHRYAAHLGLARPEGCSQEFTDAEKKKEYRIVLERMKKINCPKCPSSFTTVAGYLYHTGRCGLDAEEIEKQHHQCTVCGKKVLSLRAHMRIHEKAAAKAEMEENETAEYVLDTSYGRKSKRAAAVKAATILSEFQEELSEVCNKKQVRKLAKLFVEPSSSKVTNSIIAVWRREMKGGAMACCRFPSCSFTSDVLDDLKTHHVECTIGASLKTFSCIKCPFRCLERGDMENHVINSHVTETDGNFEMGSESDDDVEDEENYEDFDEEKEGARGNATISNPRIIDKMYGLSATEVFRLKTQLTSPLIPHLLAKYHKLHFSWDVKLFEELRVQDGKLADTIADYIPSWEESVPFTRRKISACNLYPPVVNITYERLPRFHSKLHGDTPIFFCGGPVQCAAWCPMPSIGPHFTDDRHQYLAVFAQKPSEFERIVTLSSFRSKNIIQMWNCGPLKNSQAAIVAPKIEFNVAHTFGRVWALEWCPSGCYDDTRLGLLAAACSDGTVRLFCIPRPSTLVADSDGPISFSMEPALTLSLNMSEQSECTSLHWDCTKDHRYVVAGYANGIIGLWDLRTKSPLLRNKNIIYPLWSFYGHHSVVTAVSLSPHHNDGRFIASASIDRSLKLWDRFDPRVPVCCSRRSRITHIKWRRHWPGVLINIEDVFAMFRSYTCFHDFGYTGNKNSLLPQNSVVWHSTENEYLDVVAHCTSAGEIVVYSSHMVLMEPDDKKLRRSRYVAFRTDLVDVKVEGEDPRLNQMKKSYTMSQSSKKALQGAREVVKKEKKEYSLIFNDIMTIRSVGKQPHARNVVSEMMDICLPTDKPVASIKKILYNPNFECHTWMCVCGESGLIQLLRIDSIALPKVSDLYMHELEST